MRAVLTVVGKDKKGIIARVSGLLSTYGVNIEDISQTILQDYFTMIMIVDTGEMTIKLTELQEVLIDEGKKLGVEIKVMHEDIFNCMHKI